MTSRPALELESSHYKPILESKAIQDKPGIADAKGYRSWSRKMKNAMQQVRPKARIVLELVEKMTEEGILNKFNAKGCTSKKEADRGARRKAWAIAQRLGGVIGSCQQRHVVHPECEIEW